MSHMADTGQVLSLVTSLAAEQASKESMGKCGFITPLLEVIKRGTTTNAGTLQRQVFSCQPGQSAELGGTGRAYSGLVAV